MIGVHDSTKKLIDSKCREEYIIKHPEMQHVKITRDKIIYEMAEFFIENYNDIIEVKF
jgi:hypothetical protein